MSIVYIQSRERYAPYNFLLHMLCLSISNYTKLLSYIFTLITLSIYIYMENIIISILPLELVGKYYGLPICFTKSQIDFFKEA